jgi:steroid delta-isomerase-like uncharacterized protein
MTREDIVNVFARRQELWRLKDPVHLAADHAEHGVVESPMFGQLKGRPAIEQSYRDLFAAFNDWELVGEELVIDGLRAVQIFRSTATHVHDFFGLPGTGRHFEVHGMLYYRFENGKISHERRSYDFTSLLIQIGVLRAKPGKQTA